MTKFQVKLIFHVEADNEVEASKKVAHATYKTPASELFMSRSNVTLVEVIVAPFEPERKGE